MKKIIAFAALMLLMAHKHAVAGPGYYLISTYENEGEKSIDFKFWNVKIPGSPAVNAPEIGLGYGVTRSWYTELYASYIHTRSGGTKLNDLTWQNDFLLTHGQYPFDLALHTNAVHYDDAAKGEGFEFGPIVQTEFGRTQVNANILFERNYRAALSNSMQMKYQWQAKYRWQPKLELGLQGFGELGKWDHWAAHDRQSHRAGPVVSGTFPVGNGQAIKYEAAYFIGSIFAMHADTFSMRVQYVF